MMIARVVPVKQLMNGRCPLEGHPMGCWAKRKGQKCPCAKRPCGKAWTRRTGRPCVPVCKDGTFYPGQFSLPFAAHRLWRYSGVHFFLNASGLSVHKALGHASTSLRIG